MKTCAACGAENDDTRVFCLNCAARLAAPAPGSLPGLQKPKVASSGAAAPPVSSYKLEGRRSAPRKIRQARPGFFQLLWLLLPWLLLAGLGVAFFLVLQPPADIPSAVSSNPSDANPLVQFLQKASTSPGGAWQAEEGSINRFLATAVRLQPISNPLGLRARFVRCYVRLKPERLAFTLQIAVQDHPLYLTLLLAPSSDAGRLKPRVAGAELGRLPLPSFLASWILPLWKPCFESLGDTLDVLRGAESAELDNGRLVVRWPGESASPR